MVSFLCFFLKFFLEIFYVVVFIMNVIFKGNILIYEGEYVW